MRISWCFLLAQLTLRCRSLCLPGRPRHEQEVTAASVLSVAEYPSWAAVMTMIIASDTALLSKDTSLNQIKVDVRSTKHGGILTVFQQVNRRSITTGNHSLAQASAGHKQSVEGLQQSVATFSQTAACNPF